jgi:glycosyltransferase involved in cell wall biosynthesis
LRILHISFENFQDVPGLLSRSHRLFGHDGTLVTMTPSRLGFPNGIMLDYPMLNSDLIRAVRRLTGRQSVNVPEHELKLRLKGEKLWSRAFFRMRDIIWLNRLHRSWRRFALDQYDIYHFDGDLPFIFGDRILKKLENKRIVTHFFGSELRKWGMNPNLRRYAHLKFTSELDHTKIDPSLIFVPIPYQADRIEPRINENRVLRIGHSPTRRSAKGTSDIIDAVKSVKKKIGLEFLLIEGVSNKKCMELKRTCDIGIDQIGNYAGTGYGRSGLEFLALGIPTITEIPDEYEHLLPGHPFVKATVRNIEDVLYRLLTDRAFRSKKRSESITWVREFPSPGRIMARIYEEYKRVNWI